MSVSTFERIAKTIGILATISGLLLGVYKYLETQRIEAAKPYLTKKLLWCEEAVELASSIAISNATDTDENTRFAEFYWGKMAMIENTSINTSMQLFGYKLDAELTRSKNGNPQNLDLAIIKDAGAEEAFDNWKLENKSVETPLEEPIKNANSKTAGDPAIDKNLQTGSQLLFFRSRSIAIARACRDELANEWSASWLAKRNTGVQ